MSLIIPANTLASGGYAVDNSCRFNDGSSDYLNKTLGTATNKKKFTISVWFKKCNNSNGQYLASAGTDVSSTIDDLSIHSSQALNFSGYESGTTYKLRTNALLRDSSAWYHAVVFFDSTQSTSTDRLKMYLNGTQVTSFSSATYPSLNLEVQFNKNVEHMVGRNLGGSLYMDGYIAEFCFIDGQALTPTSFGEFDEDSGIWKPIDVSGLTFGNNGFYLDFEDSGALGADVSGNGNDFTVNNLTAIDQSTDTPTNNFATWNPLSNYSSVTMSEGNMKAIVSASSPTPNCSGSIYPTTGKWYWEGKITESGSNHMFGIRPDGLNYNQGNYWNVSGTYSAVTYYADNGYVYINGSSSTYGSTYGSGDIIGVAMDLTNGFVYFSKNGTWQNSGVPTSGATGTGAKTIPTLGLPYTFALGSGSSSWSTGCEINTGNAPYAISSGNTDGNGYGNMEYAVPSGYLSLCTANLSEVLG